MKATNTESNILFNQGIDVDENKLKEVYLELEQASDCGKIKKKHHDTFHNMLLQHHYKQHHMTKK